MQFFLLLLLTLFAPLAWGQGRLLSINGTVRLDESILSTYSTVPAQARLILGQGATIQLLVQDSMHIAAEGPATLRLDGLALQVTEARALEISATNAKLSLQHAWVRLSAPGGTIRLANGRLHAVAGRVVVHRSCPASSPTTRPTEATSQPAGCSVREQLDAGRSTAIKALSLGEAKPQPPTVGTPTMTPSSGSKTNVHAGLKYYAPPARWIPRLPVTVAELSRAQRWVSAEKSRKQELAACGCAEGASTGGGSATNPNGSLSPIEANRSSLSIIISGLPTRRLP